ncbi:MAG: hypothetical protein RLZZ442_160 [Cyanobacteriota bacterium]
MGRGRPSCCARREFWRGELPIRVHQGHEPLLQKRIVGHLSEQLSEPAVGGFGQPKVTGG